MRGSKWPAWGSWPQCKTHSLWIEGALVGKKKQVMYVSRPRADSGQATEDHQTKT